MEQKIVVNILALNLSTACDMKCKRCYGHLDRFEEPQHMDFTTVRLATEQFLAQIPPDGGDIILYGGEPLLNWKLIQRYVPWFETLGAQKNVQMLLCTNGLRLTHERIDYLAAHGVRPISLSMDGDYSVYEETRRIGRKKYDHIVSMMKYALEIDPMFVVPFCVMKKKNIPRAREILSFLASFGPKAINLYRDLFEDWTDQDRALLAAETRKVVEEFDIVIQPFCESIFDCRTCYTPSVMVYPNGDLYDACYSMASVLRQRGLVSESDCGILHMGSVHDFQGYNLDVQAKRALIRTHMDCCLIDEDIYVAADRMRSGDKPSQPLPFRVMEVY